MLSEGDRAPTFTLPDQDEKPVSLDEMAGRWLVLWWFVEADTPG